MNPNDLASFRAALLEGDRRLVRRRRTRATGGAAALIAIVALTLIVLPLGGALDARALASEARRALDRPELILHSEAEVVLPDGRVDQRISRWSSGDRSRTISVSGGRTVEQASDGRTVRVRLTPGGPIDTLPAGASMPDPLLEYRRLLDRATTASETTVDGVEAYRLEVPNGVAYLRRSDRLPLRVELAGGVVIRYRVEWLRSAQLELR